MAKKVDLFLYREFSPHMKSGDLIEFASPGPIGKAIRAVTKKKVNHTAIVIRSDIKGIEERRWMLEADLGGLEPELISKVLPNYSGAWWSPLKPEFEDKRDAIVAWAIIQMVVKKRRYDFGSLFKNLLGHVNLDAARFFCSEYMVGALIAAKIIPEGEKNKVRRPGEFAELGVFGREARIWHNEK
jgi:hypothetical protein